MKLVRIAAFAVLLLTGGRAVAVEHPGAIPKDDNCSSCHADKNHGKSVHSAMAGPCGICHLVETRGDMTTMNLIMPKERICFACHQKSAELTRHARAGNQICVVCHDSHSSSQKMLLREGASGKLSIRSTIPANRTTHP